MVAKRRTAAEVDRGLDGWTEGHFDDYVLAKQQLGEMARKLEAWAVRVGHNAAELVVPEWARPAVVKPATPTVYDKVKEEKMSGLLFELPVSMGKTKSKKRLKVDVPQGK